MEKIKVMSIFGTRPEAIKMAPLVKKLQASNMIECIVCVTGQHREMLDQVLNIFDIVPEYDLNVMQPGLNLNEMMAKIISEVDPIIRKVQPDIVLVHGDTMTAYGSALAAYHNQIDIGHVEAGLRTYDKYSPFPEEMYRVMIDKMADLLFAPTAHSKNNLLAEGIPQKKIFVTGNTIVDAMGLTVVDNYHNPALDDFNDKKIILLTTHRKENLGEPMVHIFKAVKNIVNECQDVRVIYPVHLNPEIVRLAKNMFADCPSVRLVKPLNVTDFHNFQNKAYLVLTDSGGIQEEATSLGKPVLVLRNTTERPEGIEAGTLKLVGTDENTIYQETINLIKNKEQYDLMCQASNSYGDGKASERITDIITEKYSNKCRRLIKR